MSRFFFRKENTSNRNISPGIRPNLINGEKWKDTDGNFINAHGAGMLYHDETYYLFGELKKGKTSLVPNQGWDNYRVPAGGVSCYSSKDLGNWKFEGVALPAVAGDPAHDLNENKVIERPKVVYNPVTRQFVMWMHIDTNDYSFARSGVAVSDSVAGPYRYLGSLKPNGHMARDLTLFKDDDNKAYLIYSSENNNTLHACVLSEDYLSPTTIYKRVLEGRNREAPALFRHEDRYYLVTSGCTGWSPNAASYAEAGSPLGPWKECGNPCQGPGAKKTFGSQGTFVLRLKDKPSQYIFMADKWNKRNLEDSRYLWLPLKVVNGKVEIYGA